MAIGGIWAKITTPINTENNTITIKKDLLHIGENAIKIVSGGYKEQNGNL